MTKPTRAQEQAANILAEAIIAISHAARLDAKSTFGPLEVREVLTAMLRATSAFDADAIIARALEIRAKSLGLRSGTSELLFLMEVDLPPLDALLLGDDDLREFIEDADAALGDLD